MIEVKDNFLTDEEFKSIGEPGEWGVLPVRPMGATIRMTKDRRFLIRNTAEVRNPFNMSQLDLKKRTIKQRIGIKPEKDDKCKWGCIDIDSYAGFDLSLIHI